MHEDPSAQTTALLAIIIGAEFGGVLLDHFSVATTFMGGAALLVLASLVVGGRGRISPR